VLPAARDLVDEAVVERFPRVEVTSAPHVLGNLLGGPASASRQLSIEFPQEILLLSALGGDRLRGTGEPRSRLGKVEPCMRSSRALIGSRHHGDCQATNLSPTKHAQLRTQAFDRIDQDEGRSEDAAGAVQMKVDRPAAAGVQRQERSGYPCDHVIVEPTGDDHDASLEEPLIQPSPEVHALQRTTQRDGIAVARPKWGQNTAGARRRPRLPLAAPSGPELDMSDRNAWRRRDEDEEGGA
jgi:hypothetical protein